MNNHTPEIDYACIVGRNLSPGARRLAEQDGWSDHARMHRATAAKYERLLDDYDAVAGLVARGVMSDEHDSESCEASCCVVALPATQDGGA